MIAPCTPLTAGAVIVIEIAGLSAAVIPYTPIPVTVELGAILVVDPLPETAKVEVLNARGPGTSEVNVRTLVDAVAVKSASALFALM